MSYARLSRRRLLFRSFTGLEITEFDIISKEIESKYYKHEIKRLSNRKRKRDVGAGRPFKLKLRERFLMLLVYYRLYITFTLSGFLFDLDQSNVCRDICMLEPLVKRCIPLPKKLYKRTRRLGTIDEVEEYFPGFKAFIDSTEQEIPRPKNKRRRKSYYSGRKKKHTVKTQYMVNSEGVIFAAESTPLPWAPPIIQVNELAKFLAPSNMTSDLNHPPFIALPSQKVPIRRLLLHQTDSTHMHQLRRSMDKYTYMHRLGSHSVRN
jgi:hypothetical protein